MDKVVITKVGDTPPPAAAPKTAGRRKTQRTYPRGILKVKDPAKSPPLKKTARKHTIQIMTEKGARRHRRTVHRKVAGMSNDRIKVLVDKHGLLKNKNTPVSLMRDMVEGGAIAGFISLE
jgi:hypothetical protein